MKGMSWESPRGPISIDPDTRDIIQNVYIRKVEKKDGEPWAIDFGDFRGGTRIRGTKQRSSPSPDDAGGIAGRQACNLAVRQRWTWATRAGTLRETANRNAEDSAPMTKFALGATAPIISATKSKASPHDNFCRKPIFSSIETIGPPAAQVRPTAPKSS